MYEAEDGEDGSDGEAGGYVSEWGRRGTGFRKCACGNGERRGGTHLPLILNRLGSLYRDMGNTGIRQGNICKTIEEVRTG